MRMPMDKYCIAMLCISEKAAPTTTDEYSYWNNSLQLQYNRFVFNIFFCSSCHFSIAVIYRVDQSTVEVVCCYCHLQQFNGLIIASTSTLIRLALFAKMQINRNRYSGVIRWFCRQYTGYHGKFCVNMVWVIDELVEWRSLELERLTETK